MKRDITTTINYILDNLIPPFIRDNKFLNKLFFRIALGKRYHIFMNFKSKIFTLNDNELPYFYKLTKDSNLKRKTDLNSRCIKRIIKEIEGNRIIDVGCGKGYIVELLKKQYPHKSIFGADIIVPAENTGQYIIASILRLPFRDGEFDTVICSHTLEHIIDIKKAVSELRRICRKKLIVVLPCQREYKYTFDLHIHFFPYDYKILNLFQPGNNFILEKIAGDWIYIETYTEAQHG